MIRPSSRAVKAARALVGADGTRLPVPVESIASKFAVVVRETLPPEISGMLVPVPEGRSGKRWVIVVNKADADVRQRFTIAHELGHLLLHKFEAAHADGRRQIRFRNADSAAGTVLEEIEANQFAAELLMPADRLRGIAENLRIDVADSDQDSRAIAEISEIARKFKVSVQSLSFRLANLGLG